MESNLGAIPGSDLLQFLFPKQRHLHYAKSGGEVCQDVLQEGHRAHRHCVPLFSEEHLQPQTVWQEHEKSGSIGAGRGLHQQALLPK